MTKNTETKATTEDREATVHGFSVKRPVIFRDPSEYVLIAKEGSDYEHFLHGHKHLLRLAPGAKLPSGYIKVERIKNISVYEGDGRLKPKFMALNRFRI